jgi:squalene-hopene/tetraprenyl-beta-curcumene cyclase
VSERTEQTPSNAALSLRATQAKNACRDHLLSLQREDGHWCGELEGDTILGSEYVLAMHFLGRAEGAKARKAANYVRSKQLEAGGWAIYPGGPPEVSASVKAYLVLKLMGDDPNAKHMTRARRVILELGGVEASNSFTKLNLAICGEYDWERCAAVPPEIMLLPRWFYINIYEMSSWSRAILVPLSIIWAKKPVHPLPEHARIPELHTGVNPVGERNLWTTLFFGIDMGLKLLEKLPIKPSRELATKRAHRWIMERQEGSDGLAAIFPGIVNTMVALMSLGYAIDHPAVQRQINELEKLELEEEDTLRVQPCFSPVWDTALTLNALIEAGMSPNHPLILKAAKWMLGKRGNATGDWRVKNQHVTKAGWFFEYANPFYPDNDTTAKVVTALSKIRFADQEDEAHRLQAIKEAHKWHLSMQNSDGGWAAFDKDCDKQILNHVPFADHNAMLDPSNEDITARILETFSRIGLDGSFPPARRAIKYLFRRQAPDGSWYGRWGCNYLYGTWLTLWGLKCIGEDPENSEWGQRAADWLARCQNSDGGWGELPLSYDDATHKGRGPSTPSQTAWAIMGLMAAGHRDSDGVARGIDYLVRLQHEDGSWNEEYWTGTGFPGVFYLRYHLYGTYFPLLALSFFTGDDDDRTAERIQTA